MLRVITATLSILASILSVGWLFITENCCAEEASDGDRLRRDFPVFDRLLLLKYPCPPIV